MLIKRLDALDLYSGDAHEMTSFLAVTLGINSTLSLFSSPETALLFSIAILRK